MRHVRRPTLTALPTLTTLTALTAVALVACHNSEPPRRSPFVQPSTPEAVTAPALDPHDAGVPVHVEELAMEGDRAVYAVRGAKEHRNKGVFLAGVCSHPAGYLAAFAFAAAEYGDFVGVQGDVACGEGATRWSGDLASLARRMDAAAEAAGLGPLEGATLVGYSQGAERAEWLAAQGATRFTRYVIIAGPMHPVAAHFAKAHAVVFMAGARENQALMREGEAALRQAGIPATFMVLPEAAHGDMGPKAEDVVARALAWLDENDKSTARSPERVTLVAPRAIPTR